MKKTNRFMHWIRAHKIVTGIIVLVIAFGIYKFGFANSSAAATRYVYGMARVGTITTTVTGTGQVSAENQLDVKGRASAQITKINVKAGDHVKQGDVLALLDSRDATISVQNARVSYEKLVKPADSEDVQTAQDNVLKSYNDAWNAVSDTFIDFPSIITGMNSLFYTTGGFLNEGSNARRSATARGYMQSSGYTFDIAKARYEAVLKEYNSLSRVSATTSLQQLLDDTYDVSKKMAEALKNAQNTISYIVQSDQDTSTQATTNANNVNNWLNTANTTLSALISAENGVTNSEIALRNLLKGPDALDVQSGKLSLLQSEYNYQDYFVKAPFDGIVARVSAKVGDSGTAAILTLIAEKKYATISMNEVDVTKIQIGDKVKLTFDAVEGVTLDGVVDSVDLIGTVSQGVVSYNVKVLFEADDVRVKPGMSASAEITTDSKDGVLTVPNSAIKTVNGQKFVEVISGAAGATGAAGPAGAGAGVNGSMPGRNFGSTTGMMNAAMFTGTTGGTLVKVETGVSNDTNTEIVSGLKEGDRIVTRTIATTAQTATQAPSLFNNVRQQGAGAQRGAAGARTGAGGGNVQFISR